MKKKYLKKLMNLLIIKKNKLYFDIFYIFFLGTLTAFSLPPYNFWLINFFSFSLLFIIIYKNIGKNLKTHFFYGYSFGFGYFLSSLYWIPFSLSYDKNFNFLIPFAIVAIPAFLSFFYAFAFFLFRIFSNSKSVIVNLFVFSIFLSLLEFLRGNILSGFPWNLFAYSLSENINIIQINSIIGIYSFNLILITIFSAPSILFLNRNKINLIIFSFICLLFMSLNIFGYFKVKNFNNLSNQILSTKIKILSTSVPIDRYYSNTGPEEILKKLINLSDPDQNEDTIFIWPEGVLPNTNLIEFKNQFDYLFEKSFSLKHNIILGINNNVDINGDKKYYNSLSIIDNKINILYTYNKNKLVPFGEFLPLENLLSKLGIRSLTNNYQSYSIGSERKLFSFNSDLRISMLPLICYEIIYSGTLSKDNNYNFIVNISEDGWFGNSVGPKQHFVHTIFRSIEYGKYTLRSANNGKSAVINPVGIIVDSISSIDEGIIIFNQIKNVDKTLFAIYGNKIYFLIILLYIFIIFSFKKLENE